MNEQGAKLSVSPGYLLNLFLQSLLHMPQTDRNQYLDQSRLYILAHRIHSCSSLP